MAQFSMFADETPMTAPMFEQQADEVTLLFIGDLLHVTVGRAFTAEQSKVLVGAIRRVPGVESCKRDACVDGLTENSCFIVEFNRYTEAVRLAVKRQVEATIQVKQAGLFDTAQEIPAHTDVSPEKPTSSGMIYLPAEHYPYMQPGATFEESLSVNLILFKLWADWAVYEPPILEHSAFDRP